MEKPCVGKVWRVSCNLVWEAVMLVGAVGGTGLGVSVLALWRWREAWQEAGQALSRRSRAVWECVGVRRLQGGGCREEGDAPARPLSYRGARPPAASGCSPAAGLGDDQAAVTSWPGCHSNP